VDNYFWKILVGGLICLKFINATGMNRGEIISQGHKVITSDHHLLRVNHNFFSYFSPDSWQEVIYLDTDRATLEHINECVTLVEQAKNPEWSYFKISNKIYKKFSELSDPRILVAALNFIHTYKSPFDTMDNKIIKNAALQALGAFIYQAAGHTITLEILKEFLPEISDDLIPKLYKHIPFVPWMFTNQKLKWQNNFGIWDISKKVTFCFDTYNNLVCSQDGKFSIKNFETDTIISEKEMATPCKLLQSQDRSQIALIEFDKVHLLEWSASFEEDSTVFYLKKEIPRNFNIDNIKTLGNDGKLVFIKRYKNINSASKPYTIENNSRTYSLAFEPYWVDFNNNFLAAASKGGDVVVINPYDVPKESFHLKKGKEINDFKADYRHLFFIERRPFKDSQIKIWDVKTCQQIRKVKLSSELTNLTAATSTFLLISTNGPETFLYDVRSDNLINKIHSKGRHAGPIDIAPNNHYIAQYHSCKREIEIYDLRSMKNLPQAVPLTSNDLINLSWYKHKLNKKRTVNIKKSPFHFDSTLDECLKKYSSK